LSSKLKKKDKACEYYEKAICFNANDYESMIEYAALMETMDPSNALNLYTQSIHIIEEINSKSEEWEEKIFIHPEILLNISTLKLKIGMYDEAEEDIKSLMVTVTDYMKMTKNEKYQAMLQILKFNLGCVYESQGNIILSIETFEEIINENPLNLDALMKLSSIYLNLGKFKEAEMYSSSMTKVSELLMKKLGKEKFQNKLAETICFQGYLLSKLGKTDEAITSLDQIRAKCNFDDPYGKLLQASMNYEKSVEQRNNKPEQKKYLKNITHITKTVLKSDESNYYAAMGIAITFAESAHLSTAWKIFSLLLEDCEFDDIFMVNSAKLAILMRKFDTAMAVLTNYLENSATTYEDNCETLLGLAYLKNKYYEEAKRTYQRLILKFPGDQNHRLNLLTIYQEEAANLIRQEHRHVYEIEDALKYLKIIQRFLKHMQTYSCKPQSEQQQQTIEIENADSESDSTRVQESNLTKFAKLVEDKVKWVAIKLPLLEKIFVQEQETLKLRQLIRNERHAKRENTDNVEEKNSEFIMELKARQMLDDAARIAEEMELNSRRKKNLKFGGRLQGLKPPKKEQDPDKPKEVKPKKTAKEIPLAILPHGRRNHSAKKE